MKKYLLILSILCLSMPMMAAQKKAEKAKGAHPYKVEENKNVSQEIAHWTLAPRIGLNIFDGDFRSEMKHAVGLPSAGLSLEYCFTPVWAVGLDYTFDWYKVTGKPGGHNADVLLNGYMHQMDLYVSMDMINLFFPKAQKHVFGLMPTLGGGYSFYRNTIMFDDASRHHTADADPASMDKYDGTFFIMAGATMEFNLSRSVALGVRGMYNYFMVDAIDSRGAGNIASKNNDGMFNVELTLRFKFGAVKKTHVRNVVDPDKLMVKEEKHKVEQKCCHDTVYIIRDSVIVRDRIIEKTKETKDNGNTFYVYFESNQSNIDEDDLITIQQVADRLAENPELYAVVTGYCDNTGSAKLNYALGDKRAENVISELEEEHGVDSERLYSTGMGKLVGRRSQAAYGPNRRAVIRLVDKATFDRMKSDLDEKRANRVDDDEEAQEPVEPKPAKQAQQQAQPKQPVKTVPLEESARPEKVNTLKQRNGEEYTTEPTTTLSKLARKYYNNTYCWVYIYIANKDKISNPNNLVPGTTLTIPELTEQEMRITKDQSLVLYGNARQEK